MSTRSNRIILGIDLGTNSIGWALINIDDNQNLKSLERTGVRVFQEAVEAKTRTPKNQARRQARQARKVASRRKKRRYVLLAELIKQGLLPADEAERNIILSDDKMGNPYLLRKKGLDEELALHEFGRVLFHLNQRRGFKSNRKAQLADLAKDPKFRSLITAEEKNEEAEDKKPAKDDDGKIKAAITKLKQDIIETNCRTLGEYLYSQPKKRTLHTDRAMYEDEFEKLWEAQKKHHPSILTDELRTKIFGIIFHQRPLKTQKYLVGRCTFETSRKRAPKALLENQEFRILQDVNNLMIKNPLSRKERKLTTAERKIILGKLTEQETMTWGKIRRLLGLHEGELFNLEQGGKEKLIGNRTSIGLKKALGDKWTDLSEERRKDLVTDLLTIDRKDALLKRLTGPVWNFAPEEAYKLAIFELEPGYGSLSLKAINKLLPHLKEGLSYHDACQKAGYLRDDQKPVAKAGRLPLPPNLRNPIVNKALFETRKLINAIIREYGKPDAITVELARDMKLTKKEKDRINRQNKENEKANQEAAENLKNLGIISSSDPKLAKREDLLKYRLWKESNGLCPYTGDSIGLNMLFGPEVDIEHIIPYSLSLDDSFMNKTLCMASFNRNIKKRRTPYEVFSGNEEKFQNLLQRIKHMNKMPYTKKLKFELKEIKTDDFVNRQLSDTRYISSEVKEYLGCLGVPVEVSKGGSTAMLRHRWGLNRILSNGTSTDKNRSDHRHHAVDAIVIALTNRSLFQKISHLSAAVRADRIAVDFVLEDPWPTFQRDIENSIENLVVSHAACHKLTGALHEETAYGYDKKNECFVYRKPLEALTKSEVEKIRDRKIKELVKARLEECEGDLKKAFNDPDRPLFHVDGKTPIKNVRIEANFNPRTLHGIKDKKGMPYKYFKYGNNHHVEIIENVNTGKRKGVFITTLEAAKRARQDGLPIVNRDHGPDWKFIMSLAINNLIEIEQGGIKKYYRVQLLDSSNENIIFRLHNAATLDDKSTRYQVKSHLLNCSKVTVDSIGNLNQCND